MPEEPTATPQAGGEPGSGAGPEAQAAAATPETYLGTYATREDAEKGLTNLQKEKDRLAGELGHLKAQAGQAAKEQKLAEVLEQLGAQKPSAPQGPDWEAVKGNLKKSLEESDPDYLLDTLRNVIADTAGKDDVTKTAEELRRELSELRKAVADQNPKYLAHQETVAELEQQMPEVPRERLVEFASMLAAARPKAPPADTPPGASAPGRVPEPQTARQITDAARQKLRSVVGEIIGAEVTEGEVNKVLEGAS